MLDSRMAAEPDKASSHFERWRRTTLAPFEHRVFALFWWASLASSFGSMIQTVGASWLMTTIAPSPDQVALVQTANALPFFFLSLLAGALADTRDRRVLMLVSQVFTLLASAVLAVIALTGDITPPLLLGLTFLIGCGAALFAPAWQASIGDQVPRAQIAPAVMANAVGFNLARSVGPAIGGVIVAAVGAAAAFVVNAVSYLGIIATLLWWRPKRVRSELPPEPLGTAIAAGLRYVSLSPHMVAILLRCVLYTIPVVAVPALMPIVARDLLGGGAPTFGLLMGGFGIGAMLGALSSAALRQRFTSDSLLRTLSALACVAMIGIGQSHWAPLTLVAHVLAGAVWTQAFANFNIAVQLSSPRWVARVRTLAADRGRATRLARPAEPGGPQSAERRDQLDVGPDRRGHRVPRAARKRDRVRRGHQRDRPHPATRRSAGLVHRAGHRRRGPVGRALREPDLARLPALANPADAVGPCRARAPRAADRR